MDILFALVKMRLLSTSQVARLFFGAKGTCQKRLRKLFDAELVRVVVTALAEENRYAVTRLGYAAVERSRFDASIGPYRSAPRVDRRGLVHLDLLNDTRIALALGAAANGIQLVSFRPDWELRAEQRDAPIFPDAMVEVTSQSRRWQLALEIDVGTESAAVVGKKLRAYRRVGEAGGSVFGARNPTIVVVTHSERRARTLARCALRVDAADTVFAFRESVLRDGGVISGLAMTSDWVNGPTLTVGPVFSRGLLCPEGLTVGADGAAAL